MLIEININAKRATKVLFSRVKKLKYPTIINGIKYSA